MAKKKKSFGMQLAEIRDLIAEVIDTGTHQNIARTSEFVAQQLGLSQRLINYTHIEIRNKLNEFKFRKIPFNERMVFVPQCLRNSQKCRAKMNADGWHCKRCGACKINKVIDFAEKKGYGNVFIVPGGSMVFKLIKKFRPKAVVGVACNNELEMAFDKLKHFNVAPQSVLLLKDGCKDTNVNLEEVKEKMSLIEEKRN